MYLRAELPPRSQSRTLSTSGVCALAGLQWPLWGDTSGRPALVLPRARQDLTEPLGEAGGAPVKTCLRKGKTQQGREERPVRNSPESAKVWHKAGRAEARLEPLSPRTLRRGSRWSPYPPHAAARDISWRICRRWKARRRIRFSWQERQPVKDPRVARTILKNSSSRSTRAGAEKSTRMREQRPNDTHWARSPSPHTPAPLRAGGKPRIWECRGKAEPGEKSGGWGAGGFVSHHPNIF